MNIWKHVNANGNGTGLWRLTVLWTTLHQAASALIGDSACDSAWRMKMRLQCIIRSALWNNGCSFIHLSAKQFYSTFCSSHKNISAIHLHSYFGHCLFFCCCRFVGYLCLILLRCFCVTIVLRWIIEIYLITFWSPLHLLICRWYNITWRVDARRLTRPMSHSQQIDACCVGASTVEWTAIHIHADICAPVLMTFILLTLLA